MKRLDQLVTIRSGYTFRGAIDSFPTGSIEVVQAKDLGPDYSFASRPKIDFPGEDKHLLHPGDVLVSARGFAKAVLFQDKDEKVVASSSIFVLSPKSEQVNMEFITMFFNSIPGIKAVLELSSGAAIKSITKDSLGSIMIPSIEPSKERALGKAIQAIDD